MLKEFVLNHVFMSSILAVGAVSLLLQAFMAMFLKSYVKASANMQTTKKKILINLKNQFEAIYGMDCQVRNTKAYVDKYLLKLRFFGISFAGWEKLPFLSAGIVVLITVAGIFYGYMNGVKGRAQAEILFACGLVLACLFIFFHIYGIKSKKSQIQIQLVDYLENYMTNRLTRNREGGQGKEETSLKGMEIDTEEREISPELKETEKPEMQNMDCISKNAEQNSMEEDMEMLKRLLSQVENGESQTEKLTSRIAASEEELKENEVFPDVTYETFSKQPKESELELLEEFVQSFLA